MEKLREICGKIALKIDEICAVHVSWLRRTNLAGFCLGKIYNNTKVVSVAVNHSR